MIDLKYFVQQMSDAYSKTKEKLIKNIIGDDLPEKWKDRIQFIKYPGIEDEEYMFLDGDYVCKIVQEIRDNKFTVRVEI